MLSIKKLNSAAHSSKYYEKDNYYEKDSAEAVTNSEWIGKGSELLSIQGEKVDSKEFQDLLEGRIEGEKRLGRMKDGKWNHAAGWDLTFTAPKSVSIAIEVHGNKELLEAHKEAVKEAFSYMEKVAAQSRITKNKVTDFTKTGNLAAATYLHNTSRELDPNVHTHAIVINATKTEDGWRSLSSEKLFDFKMNAGKVYRQALESKIKEIGFQTRVTDQKHHFIELEGIKPEAIDFFSKRRKQILQAIEKLGIDSPEALSIATLSTRKNKAHVDHEILKKNWKNIAEKNKWEFKPVPAQEREPEALEDVEKVSKKQTQEREPEALEDVEKVSKEQAQEREPEALKNARSRESLEEASLRLARHTLEFMSERDASFRESDFHNAAFQEKDRIGAVNVNSASLLNAVNQLIENGEIEYLSNGDFSTPQAVALEKANVKTMLDGQDKVRPLYQKKHTNLINDPIKRMEIQKGFEFTQGQVQGIRHILTTQDRYVGVLGRAGTGKTTMLSMVNKLSESRNIKLEYLAPSGAAVNVLKDELGVQAKTVDMHLINLKNQKKRAGKPEMWVVDEAGMLSSRHVKELMDAAEKNNARIVFVGDTKQIESVEAGRPVAQLIENGMATIELKQIKRQKNKELLGAVTGILKDEVDKALHKIKSNVLEVKGEKQSRIEKAVDLFFEKNVEDTTLIIPRNQDRHVANALIRDKLKEKGIINAEKSFNFTVLENKNLRRASLGYANSFDKGNTVRFFKEDKANGIHRNEYFQVISKDAQTNEVTIKSLVSGRETVFNPKKFQEGEKSNFELYKTVNYELSEGDRLRWKRSDKSIGITNGEEIRIKEIRDKEIVATYSNGSEVVFSKTDVKYKHLDYSYSHTSNSAQGLTSKNSIMLFESASKNLVNQKSTYVGLSRASHEAFIVTDNFQKIVTGIKERTGANTVAWEKENEAFFTQRTKDSFEQAKKNKEFQKSVGLEFPFL